MPRFLRLVRQMVETIELVEAPSNLEALSLSEQDEVLDASEPNYDREPDISIQRVPSRFTSVDSALDYLKQKGTPLG